MGQSTGDTMGQVRGPQPASKPKAGEKQKNQPGTLNLKKVKFNKKGNANVNFIFRSKSPQDYTVRLFPAISRTIHGGIREVIPMVVAEFKRGQFIMDDAFRSANYSNDSRRKLNDREVLKRLVTKACGYGTDYFFAAIVDNEMAKMQRALMDKDGADAAEIDDFQRFVLGDESEDSAEGI